MHFGKRQLTFNLHRIRQAARPGCTGCRFLTAAILLVGLSSIALRAEEPDDSTEEYEFKAPQKSLMEYVLWPVGKILGLPWWMLSQAVGYPAEFIEEKDLLPEAESWISSDRRAAVYPLLNYESTTGVVAGAGFSNDHLFGNGIGLTLEASYSTNTYRYVSVSAGGERWGGRPFGLTVRIGWQAKTRERFFGIGPQSEEKDLTNYGYRGPFGSVTGHWGITTGLDGEAFIKVGRIDPEDGRWVDHPYRRGEIKSLFPGQDLLGLFERVEFSQYGIGLEGNWLIRPDSPLAGGQGSFRVSYVAGNTDDITRIGYWKIIGEYTQYFSLFHERVIGLSLRTERTHPDKGTRVPFYHLARLGGSSSLRGYADGRFADLDLVEFTIEYRWPLWRKLDAFIFTDQGRVFHDWLHDFAFTNFRSSYGGGLHLREAVASGSVSIGMSAEATMFYFQLESF